MNLNTPWIVRTKHAYMLWEGQSTDCLLNPRIEHKARARDNPWIVQIHTFSLTFIYVGIFMYVPIISSLEWWTGSQKIKR